MIILIFSFLTINILSFWYLKRNIMNPINILSIGFLVGALALYYAKDDWNVSLENKTVFILILGTIVYCIGVLFAEFIVDAFFSESSLEKRNYLESRLSSNSVLIIALIIVEIIVTLVVYKYIMEFSGATSLSDAISYYRDTLMSANANLVQFPGWLNQMMKVTMAGSYVSLFIFMYFRLVRGEKESWVLVIPIIVYMVQSLLMGGRLQLIRVMLFTLICAYFLTMYKSKSSNKANHFVIASSKWLIIILPFFYLIKGFLGRTSSDTFLTYIARYLGGPIECFDLYIKGHYFSSHLKGQETFASIYQLITGKGDIQSLTFRWMQSPNGIWVGNVYTGYKRYFVDFGITGVFVLLFLLGLIFGYMYFVILRSIKRRNLAGYVLMCYGFFAYSIFFEFFDDTFFSVSFSVGTVLQLLEMYIFYRLFLVSAKSEKVIS